eukprot:SAG31_NODE_42942_length_269_cov_0.882353_1_plen_29_part_10
MISTYITAAHARGDILNLDIYSTAARAAA